MTRIRLIALRVLLAWTALSLAVSVICRPPAATFAASTSVRVVAAPTNAWRGPTALWLSPDGGTLVVACDKSGTLAVIDVPTRSVVSEQAAGKSLVSIAAAPDGRSLAVCDAAANELVRFNRVGRELRRIGATPLPPTPLHVVLDRGGKNAFVTCSWSRQVVRVNLESGESRPLADLDFPPRAAILLPDDRTLAIADAFGGTVALVDCSTGLLVREVNIPGHNFRGLAVSASGRELLMSHMIVTESAPITRDNVFWGIAMTSNVRVVPIAALFDATKNPVREAHTHFFGDPNNGAGDPSAIATLSDGTTLVCLSGVGDVAIGKYQPYSFRRVHVGLRPTALAVSPDQKTVFVANSHSDTISLIDVERHSVVAEIPLAPGAADIGQIHCAPRTPTLAEEGERLFYDAKLSLDGWFSCHSCHTDGHTSGTRADTFGDGSYGAPKNVLSLLGTGASEPWAWNGTMRQLEDQVRESLKHSMQPKMPASERTVAALLAYIRTLEPPPTAAWQRADENAIAHGKQIFESRRCNTCHAPPTYTNPFTYDVGLDDGEGGNRLFNPPSLVGVAHRTSYFHDGRAKRLEDVFAKYQHRLHTALTEHESTDLVAFLRSL